jgi:hypothetical protein
VPVAVAIFTLGLVALAAVFVLYVGGRHDLPLWLNSTAGVGVPLGLALALIGLVREARQRDRSQSGKPVRPENTTSAPASRS